MSDHQPTFMLFCSQSIFIGIGATLMIDSWAQVLRRAWRIKTLDYALVGRWLGHLTRFTIKHDTITRSPKVAGEVPLGWLAHYLIGIIFAACFLAIIDPQWMLEPKVIPATVFGLVTVSFPFFVLQPSFGVGVASAKSPNPLRARLVSLSTHLAFGFGLFVSAEVYHALI
ncbi:hypothetical protein GCM10008090_24980 [Arenicella chitinivorans]|uniref:DUF2938 domain-containing protein n=1 Tax=Arenicella chitinivorans TaxID=1329800 RepID=A0A918VQG5_9GAMM|nr:DUF2938 domain-containing protein [Arenicella chitinivorans]GHA14201.1 hypothetical protein GCM10008090_24980 [Arenicella chitinivorans]